MTRKDFDHRSIPLLLFQWTAGSISPFEALAETILEAIILLGK